MTVNLKETASVGKFVPIILNSKGDIVDGEHRKDTDSRWPKIKTDIKPGLETYAARLIMNTQRRIADEKDYNEFAAYLQKTECPDRKFPYRVKSGISIAERINQITRIASDTVLEYLDEKYKQPQKVGVSPTLGKGEQVRVPAALVPDVRKYVETIKSVAKSKSIGREVIRSAKTNLRRGRQTLEQAEHMPAPVKLLMQSGHLSLDVAKLIVRMVPGKFLKEEAEFIAQQEMGLLDAETYIASQRPSYRAHTVAKDERETPRKKVEELRLGTPLSFLKLRGAKIVSTRKGSVWFKDENGRERNLHENIEELASKAKLGDRLTVDLILVPVVTRVTAKAKKAQKELVQSWAIRDREIPRS